MCGYAIYGFALDKTDGKILFPKGILCFFMNPNTIPNFVNSFIRRWTVRKLNFGEKKKTKPKARTVVCIRRCEKTIEGNRR